jgi:hypothetical protein
MDSPHGPILPAIILTAVYVNNGIALSYDLGPSLTLCFSKLYFFPYQTGYAEKFPFAPYNFDKTLNNCRWCPESGDHNACGLHRQSPVDLKRDRSITGGVNWKDCPDWHYMQERDDTCSFDDLKDSFSIERHALRLEMPQQDDGQIACEEFGERLYPRIDYSKGFPNWWWMQRVEIMAPSNHIQEGHRYPAEVILKHFYEIDHFKNQVSCCSLISTPTDNF